MGVLKSKAFLDSSHIQKLTLKITKATSYEQSNIRPEYTLLFSAFPEKKKKIQHRHTEQKCMHNH